MQFDFTDQIKQKKDKELTEIFINAKDYNPNFVSLAEKELHERNINIDASKQIREKNKEADKKRLELGKAGSPLFLFLCFILSLLGGIIAIAASYIYSYSKTKTPEGEVYYTYNKETRKLGRIIMSIGIALLALYIFWQLFEGKK